MRKLILLAAIVPALAFAAEGTTNGSGGHGSGSEFFYQAGAGQIDGTFGFMNESFEIDFGAGTTFEQSSTTLFAEFEYGFGEHQALGVRLGYTTGESEFTGFGSNDIAGLQDLEVLYKGTSAMGLGHLKYGATLEISPGEEETDSSGDKNAYSGGMALTPYIGWEHLVDDCVWGARLSMNLELGARKYENKSNSTEGENKGGEETILALFLEHKFNEGFKLGGEFDYLTIAESEKTPDGGATTKEDAPTPLMALKVYVPLTVGTGTLIPFLKYYSSSDDDMLVSGTQTSIDGLTGLDFGVNYRMLF